MRLTITIPTFNRNHILLKTLSVLVPQLTPECKLVIVDNHSDIPVEETLSELWQQYPEVNYEIVRNRMNIGAPGNGVRCFELCESEYMWMPGDDDMVLPDAIHTIFEHIDKYPDCEFFNFASPLCERDFTVITDGLAGFISNIDNFSNVMFITASVYRVPKLIPKMAIAHRYVYSNAPQFALLLVSLDDTSKCCLCSSSIVEECMLAPEELRYSVLWTALGLITLAELVDDARLRRILADRIIQQYPPLRYIAHQLCLMAIKNKNVPTSLYLYDQICSRIYYYKKGMRANCYKYMLRILVRFPRFGIGLISLVYRLSRGKEVPFKLMERDHR